MFRHAPPTANRRLRCAGAPTPISTRRKYLAHDITVQPGSRMRHILGDAIVPVNRIHHQAIKDLAPTAYAPDGIIEGVEGTDSQYLIAVQWHPEELTETQPGMARLFTTFADTSSAA